MDKERLEAEQRQYGKVKPPTREPENALAMQQAEGGSSDAPQHLAEQARAQQGETAESHRLEQERKGEPASGGHEQQREAEADQNALEKLEGEFTESKLAGSSEVPFSMGQGDSDIWMERGGGALSPRSQQLAERAGMQVRWRETKIEGQ